MLSVLRFLFDTLLFADCICVMCHQFVFLCILIYTFFLFIFVFIFIFYCILYGSCGPIQIKMKISVGHMVGPRYWCP